MAFDLHSTWSALPALIGAARMTLGVSLAAMALGLAGAIALTFLEARAGSLGTRLLHGMQSLVFGMPPLVMILMAYYVLPAAGIDLGALGAGIAALSIFSAFFLKEALRGAFQAIPGGLIEAAEALGLKSPVIWFKLRIPLILRGMIPALVNEATLVVKATALLSAITVTDVMRSAQQIYAANYRPIETLLAAALVYAAINLTIAFLGARLEARFRLADRP
ncbi:ABC transporter permease subunit [Paracoccus sp. MBLB3053]|uniref:ABC transporter permease subunit n=1 Tax=Paracoccus aurantius TaxID=3073814 RepID=A0ABU2HVV0_9RHOB|nr:ABC transporter permease subunit [Paracoccus sp. MBLB3053]MDS9469178.1 ABC transporter permease subunit [Paracoccus sp. MBLB3053]